MGVSFFKRTKIEEPPVPGSRYRRVMTGGVVETAEVLSIFHAGIPVPHVRFLVRNEVTDSALTGSLRTLSVESFQRLFDQRVAG